MEDPVARTPRVSSVRTAILYAIRSATGPVIGLGLAFGVWVIATRTPDPGIGLAAEFDALLQKQVDITVDRAKLYFSWAVGLTVGIGFFLKTVLDREVQLRRRELVFIEIAMVATLLSIVFGEIMISNVLALLAVEQFSVENGLVKSYSALQYWSLLLGLAFAVAFVHDVLWRWIHEQGMVQRG